MTVSRMTIGVIGAGNADHETIRIAEEVGRRIAENGALLVCGGLSGVMEAAAKGAKNGGGTTIGILPGNSTREANAWIDIPVATGLGEARNIIIVRTADALIAVGGEYGTLSEIAFALKSGKPVIGLKSWDIPGMIKAEHEADAVDKALAAL
jgi:uncharacterized protein (TIGR00725 family)